MRAVALLALAAWAVCFQAAHATSAPKCQYEFFAGGKQGLKAYVCWNGMWLDKAAATYSWTVKNVANYLGGAIAGGNADPLINSYGVAHVTPSSGGTMARMQMSGNLKNVAAYDGIVLSQLIQWLCAGTATAVVITEAQASEDGTSTEWQVSQTAGFRPPKKACPPPPKAISAPGAAAASLQPLRVQFGVAAPAAALQRPAPTPEAPQCACDCAAAATAANATLATP